MGKYWEMVKQALKRVLRGFKMALYTAEQTNGQYAVQLPDKEMVQQEFDKAWAEIVKARERLEKAEYALQRTFKNPMKLRDLTNLERIEAYQEVVKILKLC